jgi:pimeloyl-ACP methyl ester carboxylesterase
MPLTSIFRLLFTLVSWVLLAGAVYLLWRYAEGTVTIDEAGSESLIREPWMLWTGLVLGLWSIGGGKFLVNLILARGHDDVRPHRNEGVSLPGADGAELYVETAGRADGPTLVLTHGSACDTTAWYLAQRDLGDRFRLVMWDLPGLGKSKARTISLESYAENLRIVVQSVGGPVIVVGHSMGGMTIQTLAKLHPELFSTTIIGTVLVNTTYTNPLKTMILSGLAQALQPLIKLAFRIEIAIFPLAWISAWQSYLSGSTHMANRLTFGKGVTRTQLDHISLLGTRNSPASIARGNLAMIDWDATGAVANIPGPVLLIAGDGDIVTKPDASSAIARKALAPELHRVESANHMSFLDHAAHYHAQIAAYADAALTRAVELHTIPPQANGGLR